MRRILTTESGIEVATPEPQDATEPFTKEVMRVFRDANKSRFGDVPDELLDSELETNAEDREHVGNTQHYLADAEQLGWQWAVATRRNMGIIGLSLYIADRPEPGQLFLAELHTRPEAQGEGVASAVALAGLYEILKWRKDLAKPTSEVHLFVARKEPRNPSEFPYNWYSKLGFSTTGKGHPAFEQYETWHMKAGVHAYRIALERRVSRAD